jgi:hypothetical protein
MKRIAKETRLLFHVWSEEETQARGYLGSWKETSITQCDFSPRVLGVGWEGHPFPTCPFVLSSTPTPTSVIYEFLLVAKMVIMRRSVLPNLAIYKNYEVQIFIHPSMFLATDWRLNINIWQFFDYFFWSLLAIENLQNHFIFYFLISVFGKFFANKEEVACTPTFC